MESLENDLHRLNFIGLYLEVHLNCVQKEAFAFILQRRIRMVFIEAKLRGWGRAETVITILDNDVASNDDPTWTCNLEDVVEAVRNCGDRRSSLKYLKQECGCCFSLYPMPKVIIVM